MKSTTAGEFFLLNIYYQLFLTANSVVSEDNPYYLRIKAHEATELLKVKLYAIEELIAELASAFLCAKFGIARLQDKTHAKYMAHWLNVIKNDKLAIFYATRSNRGYGIPEWSCLGKQG